MQKQEKHCFFKIASHKKNSRETGVGYLRRRNWKCILSFSSFFNVEMPLPVIGTQLISKISQYVVGYTGWRGKNSTKGFVFEINPEGLGQYLTLCSFDIVTWRRGWHILWKRRCSRISGVGFELGWWDTWCTLSRVYFMPFQNLKIFCL